MKLSPLASAIGALLLAASSFIAMPVTVGAVLAVVWLTTVGTSGGAMLTARPLLVSRPLLPARSLTLALML